MQEACELQPSTMAAVLGLDNEVVESICNATQGVVVAANYNCPGQLVISGGRRRSGLRRPFRGWRSPGFDAAGGWSFPQPPDGACAGKTRPSH